MAAKSRVPCALLVLFNLLLFSLVSGQPTPSPAPAPAPATPPAPTPAPVPAPPPPLNIFTCIFNVLRLVICAPFILLRKILGFAPNSGICCNIVRQIPSNNLASCLCIAARASVLGLSINAPGDIKILLNICGLPVPIGFGCA